MSTALLDELYFLLAVPVVALAVGLAAFLPESAPWLEGSVATIFAGGYAFMATLATLLSTALFFAPDRMQALLTALVQGRWLRRWREAGVQLAAALRQASGPSHDVLAAVDGRGGGHRHQLDCALSHPERLVDGLCGPADDSACGGNLAFGHGSCPCGRC